MNDDNLLLSIFDFNYLFGPLQNAHTYVSINFMNKFFSKNIKRCVKTYVILFNP